MGPRGGQRTFVEAGSLSAMWVSGMDLRSAGLEATAFTCRATSPTPFLGRSQIHRGGGAYRKFQNHSEDSKSGQTSTLCCLSSCHISPEEHLKAVSSRGKSHHKPCAKKFVIQAEIRGPRFSLALVLPVLFARITHPSSISRAAVWFS